ncbi:MAG TPA: MarR family transcriptional regulator [Hyphomicrobiales bacterium]|nr:MarR family transcriptional regulator [Hyphomicrobiales bacterium]
MARRQRGLGRHRAGHRNRGRRAIASDRSALAHDHLDAEYKVRRSPGDHRTELRLWLRLLTCANLIEAEVRRRLREEFGTTLPRFDLMAQLERAHEGILLGELSRRMMVSNGNVTGLVERLVQEGLIERQVSERDRRAVRVRLTQRGAALFARMAKAHGEWLGELIGALGEDEQERLLAELGDLKDSVRLAIAGKGGKARRKAR